jgi:hypothetical protein
LQIESGMSEESCAPIYGSCPRCSCALGFHAARKDDEWYCCGPCSESNECFCGCQARFVRRPYTDHYVPVRRMFGARYPDELRHGQETRWDKARAFPFEDRRRGR